MTTKAVTLAQKNGNGTDVLLPNTSADLVGYEREGSEVQNVKEALDELYAGGLVDIATPAASCIHAIRFGEFGQSFNLVNYTPINNPENLIVLERKENTEGLLQINDNTFTFLEDGIYIITFNYGIPLGSSYNGDCLFLISINDTTLENSTDRLAGQGLNDDYFSHAVVGSAKAGDELKFSLRTPTAGQFNIIFHEVAVVKLGYGSGSGNSFSPSIFDPATIHPSADGSGLLDLGGEGTPADEGLRENIDTLLRAGLFSSYAFDGTVPNSENTAGILLNAFIQGRRDRKFWGKQFFVNGENLWLREALAGVDAGVVPQYGQWRVLGAPKLGVYSDNRVGSYISYADPDLASVTLPAAGVWLVSLISMRAAGGTGPATEVLHTVQGLIAGGTVLDMRNPQGVAPEWVVGFIWRVA